MEKNWKTDKILKKIKNVQLDTYQSLNIFIAGNTESVYANPWRISRLGEIYMERDLCAPAERYTKGAMKYYTNQTRSNLRDIWISIPEVAGSAAIPEPAMYDLPLYSNPVIHGLTKDSHGWSLWKPYLCLLL